MKSAQLIKIAVCSLIILLFNLFLYIKTQVNWAESYNFHVGFCSYPMMIGYLLIIPIVFILDALKKMGVASIRSQKQRLRVMYFLIISFALIFNFLSSISLKGEVYIWSFLLGLFLVFVVVKELKGKRPNVFYGNSACIAIDVYCVAMMQQSLDVVGENQWNILYVLYGVLAIAFISFRREREEDGELHLV